MLFKTEKSDYHFRLLGDDKKNRDSALVIFTWLRAVQPRNCGSVLGRVKKLTSSLIYPHHLCGAPSLLCSGYLATSLETERPKREFDPLFTSSSKNVWSSASTPLYAFIHSTEEQLYEVMVNYTVTRSYLRSANY